MSPIARTPPGRSLPDKLFFKIGEVAEIVGVKPHVLRYWEEEFSALRPKKTRGSHRQYARRDVELAMLIKRLVHDDGYTLAGARKRLKELGRHKRTSPSDPNASRAVALRAELLGLRRHLEDFLDELTEEPPAPEPGDDLTVTVHRVVPSRVPVASRKKP